MKGFLFILLSIQAFALNAQHSQLPDLNTLMLGEDFIGYTPENPRWSLSGKRIYFDWNPDMNPDRSMYTYDLNTQQIEITSLEDYLKDPEFTTNNNSVEAYFVLDNVLFRYDYKAKQSKSVIDLKKTITDISFNSITNLVYIFYNDEVVSYNPRDKSLTTILSFERGEESVLPDSTILMREESKLFEYHKIRSAKQAFKELEDWNTQNNNQVFIGKSRVVNMQVSTTGRYVTFRLDQYSSNDNTDVMNFISNDGIAKPIKARPKVGSNEPDHQLGIFDLEKDSLYYVDLSNLPGIRNKPAYLNDTTQYEKDRKIIPHSIHFASKSDLAFLDIRSYDNKDRWLAMIDITSGKLDVIERQHDEAWIGGPGISSWNMTEGNIGWINEQTIYFQSEESGYSHLYSFDIRSKQKTQLTSGKFEVRDVVLAKDKSKFYLTTNRSHPGSRDFELLDLKTKKLTSYFSNEGAHEVEISPDGSNAVIRYSTKNHPWELYLSTLNPKSKFVQLTHSTSKEFDNLNWHSPRIIQLSNGTDQNTYARLYEPDHTNGASVIFVHGAGYLQNAHNYWSLYYHEYLFHNFLIEQGYTVLDIDYRASDGYGRDHRTAIYRHMGGADLEDQLIGRQYLIDSLNLDQDRIGIYGGSYGGFITMMALLKEPGKFKCGAALRSVTDWFHYNHEYTSNILNYPNTDPDAYRISSPIYYAENLSDHLLMLHGMVDDNVQFQDVVRLSQRFIELGKKNWDLAIYPVEAHSFKTNSSWQDEYRRIFELFEKHLKTK